MGLLDTAVRDSGQPLFFECIIDTQLSRDQD